ncbi:hypothetical protein RND71_034396 [Anisodus tanguticus]|uniref:Uncharacterized protein n=1 Tax=Anisodus tanguticus TaxID=243964 RepID=A0AAE1RC37_9SOLA|nr:hypothetical protein RND71_034396 [Anisodus tanguticus]
MNLSCIHSARCEWISKNNFINFVGDCVVIESSLNFKKLVAAILKQIEVDSELNIAEIKFIPKDDLASMIIYNNTDVRVYMN